MYLQALNKVRFHSKSYLTSRNSPVPPCNLFYVPAPAPHSHLNVHTSPHTLRLHHRPSAHDEGLYAAVAA